MSTNNTRQAAWVAIGSVFSYCFSLLSSIILSRYFDKTDYGTYQQVLYVYHTLLAVFTLGLPKTYSFFLPRAKNEESKDIINKINHLFFALGGLFSLFLFVSAPIIADLLNNQNLTKAIRYFSPVPFFMLPTMGLEGILATYRKTKFVALYTATTRMLSLCFVALPIVVWGGDYIQAIIGFTLSSLCAFVLAIVLKYYPVRQYEHGTSTLKYKDILKFALPLMYASIGGILINSTDQFFISYYFGTNSFAEFSNGAIELPFATLIIGASSTVLTPLFAKQATMGELGNEQLYKTWKSTLIKTSMLIYPILFFCMYDSSELMVLLYGDKYQASGVYFAIKVMANFVKVIPYAPILIAIGSVTYYAKVMIYSFLALALSEYLSIIIYPNPKLLVLIHTLFTIIIAILYIRHAAKFMKEPFRKIIPGHIWQVSLMSILSIFMVFLLNSFVSINHVWLKLTIDSIVFFIVYYSSCSLFKFDYISIIKPLFKK